MAVWASHDKGSLTTKKEGHRRKVIEGSESQSLQEQSIGYSISTVYYRTLLRGEATIKKSPSTAYRPPTRFRCLVQLVRSVSNSVWYFLPLQYLQYHTF